MGMVSLQALALVIYALGRDVWVASGGAVLIYVANAASHGVAYPIWLLGTSHTYGVLGLSVAVLALGVIGSGRPRAGAFLVGVAPSVHAALGLWLIAIFAGAGLWDRRWMREWLVANWRPMALGFLVTGACATIHFSRAMSVQPSMRRKRSGTSTRSWPIGTGIGSPCCSLRPA